MAHVKAVKVLSSKTLGYSAGFKKTHREKVVETVDGEIVTAYCTDTKLDSGMISNGHLTSIYPLVAVPAQEDQ